MAFEWQRLLLMLKILLHEMIRWLGFASKEVCVCVCVRVCVMRVGVGIDETKLANC